MMQLTIQTMIQLTMQPTTKPTMQPTMQSQNESFPSFACDLQTHFSNYNFFFFFFFFFRPFASVRGGHSVSSFSKSFCLQHPSPLDQLPSYLLLLHLIIFSLVSLFSSFPVTPFPSSFFLHTLGISS